MKDVNIEIFFDESGKNKDRPTTMGGLLIPKGTYQSSDFQDLNKRLCNDEITLHWTSYRGDSKDMKNIKEVISTFATYSSLMDFNMINYIKPDRIKQSIFDDMIYSKLPERIIYGLLRYKGLDSVVNANICIEKATEYEKRNLKKLIKDQLDIQSIYRGENFKILKCDYYTKNQQIGLEITDLILGFIRTIINNDKYTKELSKTKRAKNKLVVELLKNKSFYNFMSNIDYFEWTSSSELKQVDFSGYIKSFLSNSEDWLNHLKEESHE